MKILLIKNNRIYSYMLPKEVKDNFWITDIDSFDNVRNLINVEAVNGEWVLVSNYDTHIIDSANMYEKFADFPEMIELTKQAVARSGLKPKETYVRGGTDGAELTLRGLLTPNLGAGGENFHSLNEFVSLETMGKCTENLLNIIQIWQEQASQLADKIKVVSPCR